MDFMAFEVELFQLNLLHLRPGCHFTPVGCHGRPKTLHGGFAYRTTGSTQIPFNKYSVQAGTARNNIQLSIKLPSAGSLVPMSVATRPAPGAEPSIADFVIQSPIHSVTEISFKYKNPKCKI